MSTTGPGRLRVGLIVPGFSASDEDWCIPALLTLVRRLTPRVDLDILTLRYPSEARRYTVAGASVRALGGVGATRGRKVGLIARAVRAVVDAHGKAPYDLLHAMWADEPGAVAVAAARLIGRPALVSVMGGELVHLPAQGYGAAASWLSRLMTSQALRRASLVTAGSAQLAASVAGHTASAVRLAPLGVDLSLFSPEGPRVRLAGRWRLLSVASLSPVKDHATLLEALRRVGPDVPLHLHLVGDGPLRADLEARALALGLRSVVTFHGEVPHHLTPGYYRAADLVVVSSRFESQSMVALEAAACAVPLAGTSVGLLPELDGVPVVPPGNPDGLGRAIRALALDRARRLALRQTLRRQVETTFDVEQTTARLLDLYGECRQNPVVSGRR